MAEVKDYVKRMIEEREEYKAFIEKMDERRNKLLAFMGGDTFSSLSIKSKDLLAQQNMDMREVLWHMNKLVIILSERIRIAQDA